MTRTTALFLVLAATGLARAQSSPVGEYTLEGRYSTNRRTSVKLAIERNADGSYAITRTGRFTGSSAASSPDPFTWVAARAVRAGNQLFGLFETGAGVAGALEGAGEKNVFLGRYSLSADGAIAEQVLNQTRNAPDDFWSTITTRGRRVVTAGRDLDALLAIFQAATNTPGVLAAKDQLDDMDSPVSYAVFRAEGATIEEVKAGLVGREQTDLAIRAEGEAAVDAMAQAIKEPLDWAIQDEDSEAFFQPIAHIADGVEAWFKPASAFRSIHLIGGTKTDPHWLDELTFLVVEDQAGKFLVVRTSLAREN